MPLKIGILGYGKLGSAIASGLISRKFDAQIHAYDKNAVIPPNIKIERNEIELLKSSDLLIIAIKPQDIGNLLAFIAPEMAKLKPFPMVISVAAGIPISFYEGKLGSGIKLMRVMPNIAAICGESASAYAVNGNVNEKDAPLIESILKCIGKCWRVDEKDMDAIPALSASGPAYFFKLAEAMAQAGVKEGLEPTIAKQLAIQTLIGSAALLKSSGESPSELREKVTSPNGTTHAALKELQEGGFDGLVASAVHAARARSAELSKG